MICYEILFLMGFLLNKIKKLRKMSHFKIADY